MIIALLTRKLQTFTERVGESGSYLGPFLFPLGLEFLLFLLLILPTHPSTLHPRYTAQFSFPLLCLLSNSLAINFYPFTWLRRSVVTYQLGINYNRNHGELQRTTLQSLQLTTTATWRNLKPRNFPEPPGVICHQHLLQFTQSFSSPSPNTVITSTHEGLMTPADDW